MKPVWLSCALTILAGCADGGAPVCDERDLLIGYEDMDDDGWGTGEPVQVCPELAPNGEIIGLPTGLAETPLDCNDEDPSINPEVLESCNGID
ncbi:MAG: putative metal-binding motif-containing protein, partial [Myxococcota bacterium]